MQTHILSVFLDYKCNFWCDHCSVGSNPRLAVPMEEGVFNVLLDELCRLESVKLVAFTGGECTLHMERLTKGIEAAKRAGKMTRIVTNGWFAKSDAQTEKFLDQLCEAGLDELSTSFDAFHEPFVSIEQIGRMLRKGSEKGLRLALGVIEDSLQRWTLDKVRDQLSEVCGWGREELDDRVSIISDSPIPVGTADRPEIYESKASASVELGCSDVVKTISIHPNGDVKACCGHTMFYQKDLHLGNIKDESIEEITARASQNSLYWYLHVVGPAEILRRLGKTGHYTSICHACTVLLNDYREEFLQYLRGLGAQGAAKELVFQGNLKQAAKILISDEEQILRRLRSNTRIERQGSRAFAGQPDVAEEP